MRKKLSHIRAMLLVAALELEKLEMACSQAPKRRPERKPPHVELRLIKGGKG